MNGDDSLVRSRDLRLIFFLALPRELPQSLVTRGHISPSPIVTAFLYRPPQNSMAFVYFLRCRIKTEEAPRYFPSILHPWLPLHSFGIK